MMANVMTLRTLVSTGVADSEYSSPLCNPRVLSLRAEASSRSIVDIDDRVADINNLTPPLRTPTLGISAPGISPARVQDQDLSHLHYKCLVISHLKMLHQAADGYLRLSHVWLSYNRLDNILIWPLFKQSPLNIGGS